MLVTAPDAQAVWKGEAELGFVATRGNSETETFNLRFFTEDDRERWRHRIRVDGVRATEGDSTTAERYVLDTSTNYKLNQDAYIFGNLRYDRDRLSGFDFQLSMTGGYGRRWMPRTTLSLELEGGVGVRQSRVRDGQREDEGIVRGAFSLSWVLSPTAEFRQRLTVESGASNTLTESITSLKTKVIGRLAMKLSLTVKRNSDVPVGIKNTDTLTAVNLVYDF